MSDLISRKDVLHDLGWCDYGLKDWQKWKLKMMVRDIPSAQSTVEQIRWIPVSERLPEKDGEYLVESTRGYEVLYYRDEKKQFGLMVFNFAGKVEFVPKKVYEWMPIPDAYKEGDE